MVHTHQQIAFINIQLAVQLSTDINKMRKLARMRKKHQVKDYMKKHLDMRSNINDKTNKTSNLFEQKITN